MCRGSQTIFSQVIADTDPTCKINMDPDSSLIQLHTAGGLETGRFFERFMKMDAKQKVAVVR